MSYQVLARKWRPRTFREMVGQEHVLQALINALDHSRLHHAYLFTGTRGVGKTTIARILAKCLNCEVGVSSEPCGHCGACTEINEGRFVDLIEVDAASRTKVEDTRELLENVQYAPTRGRYKVYLIDEVHMLSSHSFNALLKTLEEPPPHIKFLLATTDPQKLPVTILSRCLQFNLKNMQPERIVQHLQYVLEQEMVPFEESALWQLGRAADGSMRDAMSLTDQAISYGGGKIAESEVRAMLGTIDQALVYEVLEALASLNGQQVLAAVAHMSEHSPDYHAALAEFLAVLHRIAIAQALPEAVDNSFGDRQQVLALAQRIAPEDIQLFYQTALLGRRDLHLAPDPRGGFEMVLLRMLAFKPQGVPEVPTKPLPGSTANKTTDTGTQGGAPPIVSQEPQRDLNKEPQRDLNKEPQRDLNKEPQPSLNQEPQRGLNKEPQPSLNQEPQPSLNQKPQLNANNLPQAGVGQGLQLGAGPMSQLGAEPPTASAPINRQQQAQPEKAAAQPVISELNPPPLGEGEFNPDHHSILNTGAEPVKKHELAPLPETPPAAVAVSGESRSNEIPSTAQVAEITSELHQVMEELAEPSATQKPVSEAIAAPQVAVEKVAVEKSWPPASDAGALDRYLPGSGCGRRFAKYSRKLFTD